MRSSGAEYPDRSHSPDSWDTAEDFGIDVCWNGEGKDSNTSASKIQGIKTEAVLGQSLMDEGLLRGYGGLGYGKDSGLC